VSQAPTGESSVAAAASVRLRWSIGVLLFLITVLNYVDRQVFSILAPDLQEEIGWSELDYGRIVIAFQVAYALAMVVSGRVLDWIGTKLGLALAVLTWSLAAAGHALARTAAGFGVARFALGVGEAANFPAAIKAVAEWFPARERALATGLFNSGVALGTIIASITVPLLAAEFGWQATFVVTGAAGLLWLPIWWALYPRRSARPPTDAQAAACFATGRPGPTRSRSRWRTPSGGSTSSGCRSSWPSSSTCAVPPSSRT
jgi:ACS family hexuronate transporter-like MFS transporter